MIVVYLSRCTKIMNNKKWWRKVIYINQLHGQSVIEAYCGQFSSKYLRRHRSRQATKIWNAVLFSEDFVIILLLQFFFYHFQRTTRRHRFRFRIQNTRLVTTRNNAKFMNLFIDNLFFKILEVQPRPSSHGVISLQTGSRIQGEVADPKQFPLHISYEDRSPLNLQNSTPKAKSRSYYTCLLASKEKKNKNRVISKSLM